MTGIGDTAHVANQWNRHSNKLSGGVQARPNGPGAKLPDGRRAPEVTCRGGSNLAEVDAAGRSTGFARAIRGAGSPAFPNRRASRSYRAGRLTLAGMMAGAAAEAAGRSTCFARGGCRAGFPTRASTVRAGIAIRIDD